MSLTNPNKLINVQELDYFEGKVAAKYQARAVSISGLTARTVEEALGELANRIPPSTVISNVAYDGTNKKITKTVSGSVVDVVSAADIVTDGGGIKSNPVMTGATASAAGEKGLVPKPAAGDNDKFLRGDGTWSDNLPRASFVGTTLVFSSGGVFSGTTLLLG